MSGAFSLEQKWQIITELELTQDKFQEIEQCLANAEKTSDYLVRQVIELLEQLKETSKRLHEISVKETGVTKVDVIEFNKNRDCQLRRYQDDLKAKLSRAIGYSYSVKILW
jgi:serine protease inhibitor ecotin